MDLLYKASNYRSVMACEFIELFFKTSYGAVKIVHIMFQTSISTSVCLSERVANSEAPCIVFLNHAYMHLVFSFNMPLQVLGLACLGACLKHLCLLPFRVIDQVINQPSQLDLSRFGQDLCTACRLISRRLSARLTFALYLAYFKDDVHNVKCHHGLDPGRPDTP